MNSPFKMKLRGNFSKTGHGIPAPLRQSNITGELSKAVEDNTQLNYSKKDVEKKAVIDSIAAASSYKGKKFLAKRAGNKAANETRVKGGVPKVQLYTNPHMYGTFVERDGSKDTYFRDAPVEGDIKTEWNNITGQLGLKKPKSKK